jgi:hypothetical protein
VHVNKAYLAQILSLVEMRGFKRQTGLFVVAAFRKEADIFKLRVPRLVRLANRMCARRTNSFLLAAHNCKRKRGKKATSRDSSSTNMTTTLPTIANLLCRDPPPTSGSMG